MLLAVVLMDGRDWAITLSPAHHCTGDASPQSIGQNTSFTVVVSSSTFYSGLSISPSPNPLKNILQIIEEEPEWIVYDRWGTVLPEGQFAAKIGPDEFKDVLVKYGGEGAVEDWFKVVDHLTKPGIWSSRRMYCFCIRCMSDTIVEQ